MAKRINHRRVGKCTSVHSQALIDTKTLPPEVTDWKTKLCSMSSDLRGTVRCYVLLCNTQTLENGWKGHCVMKQMGWWLNAVVTQIQQPSDASLKTPSPAGLVPHTTTTTTLFCHSDLAIHPQQINSRSMQYIPALSNCFHVFRFASNNL